MNSESRTLVHFEAALSHKDGDGDSIGQTYCIGAPDLSTLEGNVTVHLDAWEPMGLQSNGDMLWKRRVYTIVQQKVLD
jgi:hypothetical protein